VEYPDYCDALVSFAPKLISGSEFQELIISNSFPMYVPVNAANIANMNWSIAVIGAVVLFPGIWWVWRARHVYIKEGSEVEIGERLNIVEGVAEPSPKA
jgi:choline transport protein